MFFKWRWFAQAQAKPTEPIRIVTSRLIIRELEERDAGAFLSCVADPNIDRFGERPEATDLASALLIIRSARKQISKGRRSYFRLAIEDLRFGHFIGDCSICPRYGTLPGRSPDIGTIGFQLDREFWGHGLATEAVRTLLEYAFAEVGVGSVIGGCHPENVASRRVMEKAGMTLRRTEYGFPGGPLDVESLVFAADRASWSSVMENSSAKDSSANPAHHVSVPSELGEDRR